MRSLLGALVGAAALVAAAGAPAGGVDRSAFADGRWTGTAQFAQTIEGISVRGGGTFTLTVAGGRVRAGSLTVSGTAHGTNQGITYDVSLSGAFPIGGPAAGPVAPGTLHATVRSQGKTQNGKGKVVNTFSGLHGTCDRVTGQIVITSPGDASSSFRASFAAMRASGPPC